MCITGGIYLYNTVQAKNINVVEYRDSGKVNENGYQTTKYEGVNALTWIDEDNLLVLKSTPENNN